MLLQFECIHDERGFSNLREEWEDLWKRSVAPSYFLTHDWIRCCWQELQSMNELRIFIARDGGKAVLIAPCMKSRRVHKKFPVDCLSFIEHPETQIADLICDNMADGEKALFLWIQHLLKNCSSDWNLLALNKIAGMSQTNQWLAKINETRTLCGELQTFCEAFVIPLAGSWDEYLNSQSVRFRKTLRNIVNRIERLGLVEVKSFTGREIANEAMRNLFLVSDASWKLSDGVAITSSAGRRRFFEDLLKTGATTNGLRIVILNLNGRAIASEIQILERDTIYALRSDYDERFAHSSPGTYLQMQMLKEMFGGRYKEYNFGVGLNAYKSRWAKQRFELMSFRLFNKNFYGRLLRSVDRYHLPNVLKIPGLRAINNLRPWKHG